MPKFRRVVLYVRVDVEIERIGDLPSMPCAYSPVGQPQVKSQISAVRAGGHGKNLRIRSVHAERPMLRIFMYTDDCTPYRM